MALAVELFILFHVIAYGLIRFVFDDVISLHFVHLYAVLFVIEVGIMLVCGWLTPRAEAWAFAPKSQVDMTPWAYARPLAVTLFSCVLATYLLFSPPGLASEAGPGALFAALLAGLIVFNIVTWRPGMRRVVP